MYCVYTSVRVILVLFGQGESVDIEDSLEKVGTSEPVVCTFRVDLSSLGVFKVVNQMFDMPSLSIAVHRCSVKPVLPVT